MGWVRFILGKIIWKQQDLKNAFWAAGRCADHSTMLTPLNYWPRFIFILQIFIILMFSIKDLHWEGKNVRVT
jgi:hypothetical protein